MEYTGITNKPSITIDKIYSVHYFEYACNFSFEGESHDFWEFIYVDKGNVDIVAGEEKITLYANDIFFHEPNEFHAVHTDGKTAPNLIVVSFSCQDEIMQFLKPKKFLLRQKECNLLSKLILEAKYCFDCRLDDPYLKTIPLKESGFFGARQALFLYLQEFLICLLRRCLSSEQVSSVAVDTDEISTKSTKQAADTQLFNEIVRYLQKNIYTTISTDSICEAFSISRSRLQKLSKRRCNLGIIEYFSYLKIENAKELIRTQSMNFTQISQELGYSSVHYFSRQFKKIAGMTPSEYDTSVKLMFEKEEE